MHAPVPQGSHQSRTESYQMALPGLMKERNEDTEYTGIMKIRRTMYLCSSVRVRRASAAVNQSSAASVCLWWQTWKMGPV